MTGPAVTDKMGPMIVIKPARYQSSLLKREDKSGQPELTVAHASSMVSRHSPTPILQRAVDYINEQLKHNDLWAWAVDDQTAVASVLAAATSSHGGTTKGIRKKAMECNEQ
ncbi:hypothetical protein GN244_ATG11167 [Phytophthora infestans]|uniref:Uncharacterized protein n=1 Tax=Phytophthora infestans TaxID=4787 RepID=A0A833WC36_PHYIN|nr:hypothetical protein GN244_ATG11167 [Phytophthora infestans]